MKTLGFPRRCQPAHSIEPLEARIAPATLTWDGSAQDGDWFNPANWDLNAVPASGDTAILSIASTINVSANVQVTSFELSDGVLTGVGDLVITGDLIWTGGTMAGTGTTKAGGSASMISGDVLKGLDRMLTNSGTMTYDSSDGNMITFGMFSSMAPGVLDNTGTFNVTAGGDFGREIANPGHAIHNSGTWNVSGNSSTSIAGAGIPFDNTGTLNAISGTASFEGGFVQTAGASRLAGGILATNGTMDFQGGELSGAGMVMGNVNNVGAVVRPGGAGGVGRITISGSYGHGAGATLDIEVGGANPGQFDVLTLAPAGDAILAGALNTTLINGYQPAGGEPFPIVTAAFVSGAFGTVNGRFTAQYSPANVTLIAKGPPIELIVTTDSDVVDSTDGVVSLREAITFANGNPGRDTITFNIDGIGVHTIAPTSALPVITDPVVIDGYSQPGASANTQAVGSDAVLQIEIGGTNAGGGGGLVITAGNSTVRGLVINRFGSEGINLASGGNVIAGNFIGTDAAGNADLGNVFGGVRVSTGADNLIGGMTPAARNVISGNGDPGNVTVGGTGAPTGTIIRGNYIGTNAEGTAAVHPQAFQNTSGIRITAGTDTIIGGADADDGTVDGAVGARNVISGNADGIHIEAGGSMLDGIAISGNFIGVDATGLTALGNFGTGISGNTAVQTSNLLIGGMAAGAGNVISGNAGNGIQAGALGLLIQGNRVGTDFAGDVDLGNGLNGVNIALGGSGTPDFQIVIGGGTPAARNVISGNMQDGVLVTGLQSGTVSLLGNFIGTKGDGTTALPNGGNGVNMNRPVEVGGAGAGEGNVIAYNGGVGVVIPSNVLVVGSHIAGNSIFANLGLGIDLGNDGVTINDAGDGDSGSNNRLNYPVIDTATPDNISGSFNSSASGTFRLDFYASVMPDPTGFGEGQMYLGSTTVMTDPSGDVSFNFVPDTAPIVGSFITATASSTNDGTSEFSAALITSAAPLTYTWDAGGGADTSWFTAANWSPDGVPGAGDTAMLDIDATITLPSSTSVGTFIHNNPSFVGANSTVTIPAGVTLTVLSNFTWTGGTENGAGTTTVAAGATFTYPANGIQTFLDARTLNLVGDTTVAGSFTDDFGMSGGATINNTGVFDIQGTMFFTSGPGAFNNLAGATFKKTAGGSLVLFNLGIDFNNAGLVQVLNGTIGFRGYTQTAGEIQLNDGGALSFSPAPILNGGVLSGSGSIVGNIVNNGAIIQPGGAGAIGTITTNGDYSQGAGATIETEISGTGAGQFDVFAVGGLASIDGTLTAPLLGAFAPPSGSQFQTITAGSSISGTFATPPGNVGIEYAPRSVTLLGPPAPVETIVTTTLDAVDPIDGVVSLREAITFANNNPGLDTITFNIPGPGLQSIRPASALPIITDPVIIDGFSQPGSSANTNGPGAMDNAVRLIEVTGITIASGFPIGLQISAGGSTVEGLIVTRWRGGGIVLDTVGGNVIAGNLIGTDGDGVSAVGNGRDGISIVDSGGNTIGGNTPEARNRIVGNGFGGIAISGASATENIIQGNFIGTDGSVVGIQGNVGDGVNITGGGNNMIGGTNPDERNILSGARNGSGIRLQDTAGNTIAGNFIGTDVTGTTSIPNSNFGVFLVDAATDNLIGGTAPGAGNVISGNAFHGIVIGGKTSPGPTGAATGNVVQGNFIGTNATGVVNLGNSLYGIALNNDAANNTIGGAAPGAANVIATNASGGIVVQLDPGAVGNAILGNFIGTDATGSNPLGNAGSGIAVSAPMGAPSGLAIGGIGAGEGNVIAFNFGDGIVVDAPSRGVVILGNSIRANNGLGIDLGADGFTPNDAGDADVGANDLQNFPVLTAVTPGGGTTTIEGILNSAPNTTFRVEFFTTNSVDNDGVGQGSGFLGFTDVTTDTSGNATIDATISSQLAVGALVTATATDLAGAGTSESSVVRVAVGLGNFVWDAGGGADTSWFNPLNWNFDSGVPGPADTAILDIAATIDLPNDTTVGSFIQSDGTIISPAGVTFTIVDFYDWTGGTMSGAGITNANGGIIMDDAISPRILSGRTINLPVGEVALLSGLDAFITLRDGAVFNNFGTFLADGPGGLLVAGIGANAFNNFNAFVTNTRGGEFTVAIPFLNTDSLDTMGGTISFGGGFTQTGEGTILGGGFVNFDGGTVSAVGSIAATVSNSGAILSPGGNSTGQLTINGDYIHGPGATLRIELGGINVGEFDQLIINGAASLDGTLDVTLLNGFAPASGQQFPILTFESVSGAFQNQVGAQGLALSYLPTGAVLASGSSVDITPTRNGGVTFTDVDGDKVVVKSSKGALSAANFVFDGNGNLALIDLTAGQNLRGFSLSPFAKTKLSVSSKAKNGGDGLVNVGALNASGFSLKSVKIDGDLGKIDAGEGVEGKSAFKKLKANSIGLSATPGVESNVAGTIGVMKIKNNVKGVVNVTAGLADDAGLSATAVQAIRKVVIGGSIDGSAGGAKAGLLRVSGDISSVKVKGSVIGGADLSGIVVGGNAGKIKIGGDLMSGDADKPVTLSALGLLGVSKQSKAVALKKVLIGGGVLNSEILVGYRRDGTPINADASIGKIIVDGDWTASSAAAGIDDTTADGFGINDAVITGSDSPDILARIASITIGGNVSGSAQDGDHFGITAQQIGTLTLGRARQPLVVGAGDTIDLATDFTAVDFA